jgi:hypothetical protein
VTREVVGVFVRFSCATSIVIAYHFHFHTLLTSADANLVDVEVTKYNQ